MTARRGATRRVAAATIAALALGGAAADAAPQTYRIDPTHSAVTGLLARDRLSTVRARFARVAGSVTIDAAAGRGHVDLMVDLRVLSTGAPEIDRRLLGAEGLDVDRAPDARFVGDDFTFDGTRPVSVRGQLTLRGRTAPVALTTARYTCYTSPLLRREVCGGEFRARLRRVDWGFGGPSAAGVPEEIPLEIQVEAVRQDETEAHS